MLNQLGLSDNILTLIERRGKADLMIFFALCALTLLVIYVLYYYVKPMLTLSYIFGLSKEVSVGTVADDPTAPTAGQPVGIGGKLL